VQLGATKYNLPLAEIIKQTEPNVADIKPLKSVWETYNNTLIEIRKRQQQNNLLSRVPMVFTLLGGVVAAASEDLRSVSIVFTAIAAAVMLYGFYRIATDKSIEEQEKLKKDFQRNYVCPKCGRFLGFQDYDIISQHSNCPYCKAQYKI
jgi:rubrerythrin